jgi:ADP-ribosylglycohydrolase
MQDDLLRDRARGCIIGGAIGDAMGGPFEGRPGPIKFKEHTAWSISDDSQFTLATCESIIEVGRVSPEHIAQCFVHRYRARRISGMGSSTLKALRDLDAGAHWALAGAKGEMSAGNGAAMRIAPLAFHLNPEDDQDRLLIRDVCRITHHNEEAYAGALAMVIAIRSLAFSQSAPRDILEIASSQLPDSRVRDHITELASIPNESVADIAARFGSSGYVVESVPLALFAARSIERQTFEELLRTVIEAGGDTDTNASMTGQIAGAWMGAAKIAENMIGLLPKTSCVQQISTDFATTLRGTPGE